MANIDELSVKISADTSSASKSLTSLNQKLNDLNSALNSLNVGSLSSLSQGVMQLSSAMTVFKTSGVNRADFTRIADCLNQLSTINASSLSGLSNALNSLSQNFQTLGVVSTASQNVVSLVNAIGRFGSASVTRAIANIPLLTNALMDMFRALSTAPNVSRNVIDFTNSLANLTANGQRVASASKSISNGFKQIGNSASSTKSGIKSLASAIGKFYATYFMVIRGVKKLWQSVESSMDYVETFNYFNVTMNKMGKDTAERFGKTGEEAAKEYSDNFINQLSELNKKMTGYAVGSSGELLWADVENLGLDANQLTNFQARLGAVTNSIGLMGEVSTNTAEAMTMLASDLSSLTNVDLEDVMGNLTSGLIGQSRALYKYGVDITNATLGEYALANGITKKISAMSQSEKMQLRILAILDQTEIAYGDQANTINSVANQYRMFKQESANLGRILGSLVLPVVQFLLPKINGLIISLSKLFQTLGFKIWGDTWLTGIMDGISGAIQGTDDLEGGVDGVGDSFEDANKSAKKLKKQLQGFDELNVISDKDDETLKALTGDIDLSKQIEDALNKYKKKWNEAFSNVENEATKFSKVMDVVLKPVADVIEDFSIGDYFGAGWKVSEMATSLFNFMSDALAEVHWYDIGHAIGEFLSGIKWTEVIGSVGNFLTSMLDSAVELFKGAWDSNPFATIIVGAIVGEQFLGLLSNAIGMKILNNPIGISAKFKIVAAAVIGFNVGKWLGKKLFPKDAEYYENFHIFGDDGMLAEIWMNDWKTNLKAFADLVTDFGLTPGQIGMNWIKGQWKDLADSENNWFGAMFKKDKTSSKEYEPTTPSSLFDYSKDVSGIPITTNTVVDVESVSDAINDTSREQIEQMKKTNSLLEEQKDRAINVNISTNDFYNSMVRESNRRFNATGSSGLAY